MLRKTFSGLILIVLLTGILTSTINIRQVEASGTIYIRSDGSIDPPTAPIQRDGDLYTFTDNIYESIVVERDNIVLDGAGYTLQGTQTSGSRGIDLSSRSNVTVKNMTIIQFHYGVYLDRSSNNIISGNNIANNFWGIYLINYCNNNIISGNNIANSVYGISVSNYSNNNVISGNMLLNDGLVVWYSYGNLVTDNLVNGKPLLYLEEVSGYSVENAGQVILVNSANIQVENLNLSNASIGIQLWSTNNTIISGNNITANNYGIWLESSSNNGIIGNNITANNCGIVLRYSFNNKFYHNNFANKFQHVSIPWSGYANVWDCSYPSGGNYWSNYTDVDLYSGIYQNESGSDGIWDHPYVIDADNQDHYPLVNPWTTVPTHVQGIDVSHHQGSVDWSEVYGAGYRFAFAKATEGDDRPSVIIDPYFEINMNNGSNAGLLMGAYHVAHPEMNNATDEALFFINITGAYLKAGFLRPALDLEQEIVNQVIAEKGIDEGIEYLSNWVETWLLTVEEEADVEPIVYVSSVTAGNYLNESIAGYNLWIAHYTYDPDSPPNTGIWDNWDFWQWSNESIYAPSGYVPGVEGNVDLDVFNGDLDRLYDTFVIPIPGDVDGDFDVDIYDVVKMCSCYGAEEGDPDYDANCDVDGDGDIDIYDIVIMCSHYGESG